MIKMRNFVFADPVEMFMMMDLDDQKFPAPKSYFQKSWKTKKFDGVEYFWCGRYRDKSVVEQYKSQIKGMGKNCRITKSGNYFLIWCSDYRMVDWNLRLSVPI